MLFLPPFLVILFYNINIIGLKNRWTNRIFSKIKQILGKKNLDCFEGQRDFEIFSFILFFFSRGIIRDVNFISIFVSYLRQNPSQIKDEKSDRP